MKKTIYTIASLLLMATSAQASILQLKPGPTDMKGVNVAEGALLSVENRQNELTTVGAGVRNKFLFSVYVGQLHVSDLAKFVRSNDGALNSLDAMSTVAMQMNFIYGSGVTSKQLIDGFQEGFDANGVDVDQPEIKSFLDAVKADAPAGSTLFVAGERLADGSEIVTVENTKGVVTSLRGGKGYVHMIMALWLGKTADGGVENMKKSVIAGNKQ